MNREIEFRGKDVKSGEWLYGSYFTDGRWDYIIPQNTFGIQVVPDTVGEFIGKKDKNSIKIFEGDIVRRKESAYGLEDIGVVRYDCHLCAFVLEYESYGEVCQDTFDDEFSEEDGHYTIYGTYSYEVIGNIHVNPELLNKK
jgi:uncharacterized phage protein (TIGR01671 family)